MSRKRPSLGNPRAGKPRVAIIQPPAPSKPVVEAMRAARKQAAAAGFLPVTYPTAPGRLRGESVSRSIHLLDRVEATRLYESLHVTRVLVLAFHATYVRRDPRRDPPERRRALSLATFVDHKGLFGFAASAKDVQNHLARFEEWIDVVGCTGQDDPRALPLHVFEHRDAWLGLGDPAVRKRFRDHHGTGARRHDDGGKIWVRDNGRHGGQMDMIAGCVLPVGTHWDVTSGGGGVELMTASEVWRFGRHGGHANVYPNAHVREGDKSKVKRTWKAKPRKRR